MSEERAVARLAYGVPVYAVARDGVDRILLDWAEQRPDLDFTPVGVINRLGRLRARIDAELSTVFDRYDLTAADFAVIVTLRRSGAPFALPQARLMEALGLTSGTVSVRLDRLERAGVVQRGADPTSARASLVTLTPAGLELFDQLAPVHLANEDRLLSALTPDERVTLADLLRRLLADFEATPPQPLVDLGVTLEPAHIARARRTAVGLGDEIGLLAAEVDPEGIAYAQGLRRGDLILSVAATPVTGTVGLALLIHDLPAGQHDLEVQVSRRGSLHRLHLPAL